MSQKRLKMRIKETRLKSADKSDSGQVFRFTLPGNTVAVTHITTYNRNVLSPGLEGSAA